MRKVANFCDYFVLCSGTSDRHLRAIADGIDLGLRDAGLGKYKLEGLRDSSWVVCDTGDVVAHVFHKNAREFYGLEYLWQEAKKVKWEK